MKFNYATGSRPLDGYTIKRGVGIGGFGEVYFATSDAGKEVALKRIQRNLDVEVRGVSQCLNLKHPNLIALYDIKYDEIGEGWIVMEYVAGESLKEVVDRNPHGLPIGEVNRWFESIASGVAYLHDHGIVHRDLKPGNIFDDGGVVKIGDYGLSKFISCSRRSGQTESVGTFHYMAPEIGKGVYGKEIDIYALGIILHELLTGRVPFEGETSQEIIMKHLTADPELGGIAYPYREVIRRALLKDPDRRFSSVEEMVARLKTADGGPAVEASLVDVVRPPVVEFPKRPKSDVLYITEENADEIVFGPVRNSAPPASPPPAIHRPQRPIAAVAVASNPEPIARAVRAGMSGVGGWWRGSQMTGPVKVIILVAVTVLLLLNIQFLLPMGLFFGIAYLVYFGVRSIILALNGPTLHGPSVASPAVNYAVPNHLRTPSRPAPARRERSRVRWQLAARETLRKKPMSVRLAELTGSMLMAATVAAVVSVVAMLVTGQMQGPPDHLVDSFSRFAWITLTSAAGAWMVLAFGKFWEGGDGEPLPRRFVMLAAGLALGLVAFGGAQFLSVDFHPGQTNSGPLLAQFYPRSMFEPDGTPLLPAQLVFFGGLFAVLGWSKQSDPLRSSRFSLWATFVSVLWSTLLPLSQPWGIMLAATTSVAVQLSAPWMNSKDRLRIREQLQEV